MNLKAAPSTQAALSPQPFLGQSSTISCVVPVHNGERFLAETLESILRQSYPVYEVIVVDDGSTDGTPALVGEYAEANANQVRYFRQENSGPAAARNAGIRLAGGDYVGFLDADDLWHPDKCTRQLAHFAACPQLAISVTNVQNFWMEEVRAEEERLQGHARAQAVAGYAAQSMLAKRSVFAELGLFDGTLQHASVADWFLRVAEAGLAVELLPAILVRRRLHRDNRSRKLAKSSREEYLRLAQMTRARKRVSAAPV